MTAPVVCAVDRSRPARAAVRLGAALAGRMELGLTLVHAVPAGADPRAGTRLLAETREQLRLPRARLRVVEGPVASGLAAAEGGAALVAVGGGERALRAALTGGVPAALARSAPCPLVVVPPGAHLGGRAIVCGVRDVADAAAVRTAARLAAALALPLELVHVLPRRLGPPPVHRAAAAVWELSRPAGEDAAHRLLEQVGAGIPAAHRVVEGRPGPRLARLSAERQAAFVVVGNSRRERLAEAVAGSTSGRLMRRSACAVVVCPPGGLPRLARVGGVG